MQYILTLAIISNFSEDKYHIFNIYNKQFLKVFFSNDVAMSTENHKKIKTNNNITISYDIFIFITQVNRETQKSF